MALTVPIALTSCSDDDNALTPSQQQDIELVELTEQYLNATVIPTYTLLANGTDTLYHKLDSLRTVAWAGGTITADAISDVAAVFLRARSNYELSEAFLFGAASDFGIDPHIDSWPLDLDQLRSALLNTSTIEALRTDDGTIAGTSLGSSVLGFHGIEYVLFRNGQSRTDLNGSRENRNGDGVYGGQGARNGQGDLGGYPSQGGQGGYGSWNARARDFVNGSEDYGKLFQENSLPVSQTIILGGKYIVTPSREGLMVVNIRRARERIIFDRTISALSKNGHATQTTLFPVKVEVGVEARALFDDNAGMLASLGFSLTPMGNDTIVVEGVPEGFSGEPGKVQTMIGDLTLILADESSLLPSLLQTALAEKIAMLGASNCETMTSPAEARHLLDLLLSGSNPELTSNGRKILTIIPADYIEKQF